LVVEPLVLLPALLEALAVAVHLLGKILPVMAVLVHLVKAMLEAPQLLLLEVDLALMEVVAEVLVVLAAMLDQ
jgi:hypothetical protein